MFQKSCPAVRATYDDLEHARARARLEITRTAILLCVVAALFVFVDHRGPYPLTMFYPPVGAVFGYLVLRGPAGIPVSALALVAGNAVALPRQFAADPSAEVAHAVLIPLLLALAAHPLHRAWRQRSAGSVFGALTLFVLTGLLLAPALATAGTFALSLAVGGRLDAEDLARMLLGTSTSIAALAPGALVGAVLLSGRPPAVLRASLAGRREALVPAAIIVLAPGLALALPGAGLNELWLLPLAAVPLIWISGTGDLIRSACVLAVSSLAIGTLARGLFGEGTELYRAQVMVLGCSLATLYVAAACVTEAATRREESAASTRWEALLAVAPAVVTRVSADGSLRREDAAGEAGAISRDSVERALPEADRQLIASAVRKRHPRTLRWQNAEPDRRNFVTRVTPLPDGETLVVTTETTLADAAEATLAWERTHDRETGLPNRDLLLATAEQALAGGLSAILLVIDFNQVTRRALLLGADAPAALRALAQRIHGVLAGPELEGGLVARTGDDQLGVFVPGPNRLDPARTAQLLSAVSTPVDLAAGRVTVHGSVGLSSLEPPVGAHEALRHAAVAAQTSRERGEARIVVSDGLSLRTASERARLVSDVVAAADRSELEVVYQPDVHPGNGTLTGMEALVRWRRRDGFTVSTDDFVRVAEESGAVAAIDDWVMRAALAQLGHWRRELDVDDVELGINVSVLSLTDDLPERLERECRRNGVPPDRVRLEVTETALGDDSRAVDVLRHARSLGFRIALDDFGTGYASLSRLRTLPVDVLKLDRSFLASLTDDGATQTLVGMILGLAEPLHLDVVVEGVETQTQRQVLVGLGCQRAQGFLFSPPTGAAGIREILLAVPPARQPSP